MGRLDGKVAIVTGAWSRGVGAATACAFVAEGATVVVADIVDERGEALADELGDGATAADCDVGNEDDWGRAGEHHRRPFRARSDVLANVVGAIFLGLIADTPLQEYLR